MTYRHKRGTAFSMGGPLNIQVNGQPLADFSGWQIACQVRTPAGQHVATLQASVSSQGGQLYIALLSPDNTPGWPLGPLRTDLVLTTPAGQAIATETAEFVVIVPVTQP